MGLQISEFVGVGQAPRGDVVQIPDGPPVRVTNASGAFAVGTGTILIRIKGTGTITWPNVATPENFDGTAFRRARPGDAFTVSA